MKLLNQTDVPDYQIRRMISWVCGRLAVTKLKKYRERVRYYESKAIAAKETNNG